MRKFLCGILSVVLILSLAACGAKKDAPDTTDTEQTSSVSDVSQETGTTDATSAEQTPPVSDDSQTSDTNDETLTQTTYENEDYSINVPEDWTLESTGYENNELVSINTWTTEDLPFTNLRVIKYAQPAATKELKNALDESMTNITACKGSRDEPMNFMNQETGGFVYLFLEESDDATYIVSYDIDRNIENDNPALGEQLTEMMLSFTLN